MCQQHNDTNWCRLLAIKVTSTLVPAAAIAHLGSQTDNAGRWTSHVHFLTSVTGNVQILWEVSNLRRTTERERAQTTSAFVEDSWTIVKVSWQSFRRLEIGTRTVSLTCRPYIAIILRNQYSLVLICVCLWFKGKIANQCGEVNLLSERQVDVWEELGNDGHSLNSFDKVCLKYTQKCRFESDRG